MNCKSDPNILNLAWYFVVDRNVEGLTRIKGRRYFSMLILYAHRIQHHFRSIQAGGVKNILCALRPIPRKVPGDNLVRLTTRLDNAMIDPDTLLAQRTHGCHVMAHEQDRAAMSRDITHFSQAPSLEIVVTDSENFIDEKDIGFKMRSYRESEPHVHARRIMLHGRV